MPRRAYTPTDAEDWARRVQQGDSYRTIAHEAQVDPRTVKLAVDKLQARYDHDHWEAVRRSLDVEALRNHAVQVIAVAEQFGDIVALDPVSGSGRHLGTDDLKKLLDGLTVLVNGTPLGIRMDPEMPAARRRLLLRDLLQQHEPALGVALKQWSKELVSFAGHRRALAAALGTQHEVKAPADTERLAQGRLEALCRIPGAPADERDGELPGPTREEEAAVASYYRVQRYARAAGALIDRLALRGVLAGECSVFIQGAKTTAKRPNRRPEQGAAETE